MNLPYRTGKTWLSDDELILLDVLFSRGTSFDLLRRQSFLSQWNLGYLHSFDDEVLKGVVLRLYRNELLSVERYCGRTFYHLTEFGGDLWSRERRPVWERYCSERYRLTMRGLGRMSVVAVSARIRDDFLSYDPSEPIRRRSITIHDRGILKWRSFGRLFVRVETFEEEQSVTPEEYDELRARRSERRTLIEETRTWWRTVPELQRFVR